MIEATFIISLIAISCSMVTVIIVIYEKISDYLKEDIKRKYVRRMLGKDK